jgi:hypothetical protein
LGCGGRKVKNLSTMKTKIVLLGNEGGLLKTIEEKIKLYSISKTLYIDKYYSSTRIEQLIQEIGSFFQNKSCENILIFCGGEVRDKKHMFEKNVNTPFIIFSRLYENWDAKVIYLSSLAIYEYNNLKIKITSLTEANAKRSNYGITKRLLDEKIDKELPNLNYVRIVPASIVGGRFKRSSLDKALLAIKKYKILSLLIPKTKISFIHREEIVGCIINQICHKIEGQRILLLAHNVTLDELIKVTKGNHKCIFKVDTKYAGIFLCYLFKIFRMDKYWIKTSYLFNTKIFEPASDLYLKSAREIILEQAELL